MRVTIRRMFAGVRLLRLRLPRLPRLAGRGSRRGRRFGAARVVVVLALLLALFMSGVLFIDMKVRPIVQDMAIARVNYIANKAINDAVTEEIAKGSIDYDDLVFFEKDAQGNITALKTNMVKINQFKVEITRAVLDKLYAVDLTEIAIPLGNIINGELMSGRGPRIPVKLVPLSSASASFANVFTSAGINQTRHQVVMEVTVNISVLTMGASAGTTVVSQVNVAETVIVGSVPDSFTYFEDTQRNEDVAKKYYRVD